MVIEKANFNIQNGGIKVVIEKANFSIQNGGIKVVYMKLRLQALFNSVSSRPRGGSHRPDICEQKTQSPAISSAVGLNP